MIPAIHIVHKPVGVTSVAFMQSCATSREGQARRPKVCHGGTLDPFAHGLLLVLFGSATRLFEHLHAVPKVYEATVCWGIETDNGDPHGRVTFTGDAGALSAQGLDDALKEFVGWHEQVPHSTSAKRIGGERAYLKAHRGESVEMPASRVYLHEARWLEHDLPRESRLRIVVRGGYYVRALARDLGRVMGCGAHLTTLHRSAIGPWNDPGPDNCVEVTGAAMLPWAKARMLSDQEVGELRQGRSIALGDFQPADWNVPPDFPDPQAPIRAMHLGRFAFLLRQCGDRLEAINSLQR